MAKQIIKLTESDLHKIIRESVKRILKEEEYGDWRDDFEKYNHHMGDPETGAELERAYMDKLKKKYNGDKKAIARALNDHYKQKDIEREKFLSKNDPDFLDRQKAWERQYDIENGINSDEDDLANFDFEAEKEKAAAKRERKFRSGLGKPKKEEPVKQQPSKFEGLSPEEIELKMKEMGFAK